MTPATAGRKRSRCKVYCRSVGLLLAALCAFALFQPARASADGTVTMASVNIAKLNIRASASARARAVASAALGDVVRVTASKTVSKETWYDVSTSSGKSGWCQARYLSLETDESSFKPSSNGLLDWPSECINVTQKFTYQSCMQDMSAIVAAYPGLARIETIGTSVMGNPIDAIVLGNPDAQTKILVQASIHARELMSGLVALRQAECLLKAASMGASYKDTKVSDLLANEEIWIVPLSNPDGARLVYEGLAAVPPSMPGLAAALKKYNNGSTNFYHWKANADGVDLNRNFDDHWKPDPKYPKPNFQNYPGPAPFSEPESVALRDLTVAKDFALTISYHESGRMIYWNDPSGGSQNDLNLYIAKEIRSLNGYTVLPVSKQAPDGGYRDWYVGQYNRPGLTIELGSGYCPLPISSFAGIWAGNRFVLLDAAWIVLPKGLSSYAN